MKTKTPVPIPGSARPNLKVTPETVTIGGFVESDTGMVVYLWGWNGQAMRVSGCTSRCSLHIPLDYLYARFKHRYDIDKFPGCPDSRLPYEFDPLYNLKWESQLPQAINESDQIQGIRRLMKQYGIGVTEVKAKAKACEKWYAAERLREPTDEENRYKE